MNDARNNSNQWPSPILQSLSTSAVMAHERKQRDNCVLPWQIPRHEYSKNRLQKRYFKGFHSQCPPLLRSFQPCLCKYPTRGVMASLYLENRAISDTDIESLCLPRVSLSRFGFMIKLSLVLAIVGQSRAFLVRPSGRAMPGAPRVRPRASEKMAVDLPFDFTRSPNRWKDEDTDSKPGFGGIWPGDPNAVKHHVRTRDHVHCAFCHTLERVR